MTAMRVHWLTGLPCLGKTTRIGDACVHRGLHYIQADHLRQAAWTSMLAGDERLAARYDTCAVAAYARAFTDPREFVALHLHLGPYYMAALARHLAGLQAKAAVVEISSLYRRFMPPHSAQVRVTACRARHGERIARRLQVDTVAADTVHWALRLAEYRLGDGSAPTPAVDVDDTHAVLERFA